ncbi:MAG: D-2-hydroxyacid dehydrogenase [Vallitaleaceae bacterium]|nr:D-2-hydroxyacid dehydrogenase [Vallitaleaceae bacterium]
MKIVILDGYTENPGDLSWEAFEELAEVTVYDRTAMKDIVTHINDAEIVLTNKTPIDYETLQVCKNLKYIGVLATGFNVVDVQAAKDMGVIVTNIPTYGTDAVAQFAMALLLEICHHVGHHDNEVKKGRWSNNQDWCFWDYPLIELAGKTIGVIGFGRIGQKLGQIAHGFGMKVISYDDYIKEPPVFATMTDLNSLLKMSDVISLHCPLTEKTKGMINVETISMMKKNVIILNNSRGPLIVEQDLADALNNNRIYAAGLDVVSTEPISNDNPLLNAKNCFITPHISWAPKESRQRLMDIAVANVKAFIDGNPVNIVNA